jgi:hypothetical protein
MGIDLKNLKMTLIFSLVSLQIFPDFRFIIFRFAVFTSFSFYFHFIFISLQVSTFCIDAKQAIKALRTFHIEAKKISRLFPFISFEAKMNGSLGPRGIGGHR